ncbi:hypothetical protein RHGRI_035138 [Rhododendron griersonianum]|uniref:AP2/ERF domain-containing protein n=1 Tax=Rhododendron griersonianum TaxID=479676 RepID=A0AAV6I6S7_9ERIC|nr:hypothetical protein RHGRI_035138 [Rhododendron griersonianum]
MGKVSKKTQKNSSNTSTTSSSSSSSNDTNSTNHAPKTKLKRTRKSGPRDSPPQRSSVFRGVTRHRWTGRYEAHLWDKNYCWNEAQSKKGRQGAYDDEEAAAHAYDLAALKYWGQDTILNFPLSTYEEEFKEMEGQSREEYIGSLRRKSSGFSRGVSKYRGVARWSITSTQEEAATAYDLAAIEYRGLNAVTNFDLSRYIDWTRPDQNNPNDSPPNPNPNVVGGDNDLLPNPTNELDLSFLHQQNSTSATTATESTLLPPRSSFPDDIQTYFDCNDSGSYDEEDGITFGDLNSFASHIFNFEFDAN